MNLQCSGMISYLFFAQYVANGCYVNIAHLSVTANKVLLNNNHSPVDMQKKSGEPESSCNLVQSFLPDVIFSSLNSSETSLFSFDL